MRFQGAHQSPPPYPVCQVVGVLAVEPDAAAVGTYEDAPASGQYDRKATDARQQLDIAVGGRLAGEAVGAETTHGAAADERRVVVGKGAEVLLPADAEADAEPLAR